MDLEIDEIFKEGVAEAITVGSQTVMAIVSVDEEAVQDEGNVDVDGSIKLRAADYTEYFDLAAGPVNLIEWQGETYHVLPGPTTRHGVTTCRIRRHSQHQRRAGYMGLAEEQAVWRE